MEKRERNLHSLLPQSWKKRNFSAYFTDSFTDSFWEVHAQSWFVETQGIFTSTSMCNGNCVFSLMKSIHYKDKIKLKLVSKDFFSLPVGFMLFFCDFFFLKDHLFQLESHKFEKGRGRCPFDPSSSFTSILIGNDLHVTSFTVLSICLSESLSSTHQGVVSLPLQPSTCQT